MPCNKEKRGNPPNGLLRMPRDFSWQLLGKLASELSHVCDKHELIVALREVLRKRDPHKYHALRKCHGLQSMNQDTGLAPHTAATVRLLAEVCSKSRELETKSPAERAKEAIAKSLAMDYFKPVKLDDVLEEARLEIARLLPPVEMEQIQRLSRHGPGKSLLPHVGTSSYFKYAAYPYTVTAASKAMLCDMIRADHRWYGAVEASYRTVRDIDPWRILPRDELFSEITQVVHWNRIVTVPKDGTKDRTIAIEPVGNVLLQLGVDGVIRRALKKWDIDLDDQRRNRRLALLGSAGWDALNKSVLPASLDLSSASDRVSRSLCKLLLPPDWFDLLDRLRAPYGLLPDGTMWCYHRMSSMGNGSTFALESLLFAAIIRAISKRCGKLSSDRRSIAVYGDDCLYPAYLDSIVRHYFEYVGFIVNPDKSFSHGPVRESCGCDYYKGQDIRPVYVPESIDSAESLLALRNGLVLWWRRCLGFHPPIHLLEWLDGYLDIRVGSGPPLSEHRSEYKFANVSPRPVIEVYTLGRRPTEIQAKELEFRKLMHPLLSCTSTDGSRFRVSDRRLGALVVAKRKVFCYQAEDYPQASAVPGWDPTMSWDQPLQLTPV